MDILDRARGLSVIEGRERIVRDPLHRRKSDLLSPSGPSPAGVTFPTLDEEPGAQIHTTLER
jgi:hypothetical protein